MNNPQALGQAGGTAPRQIVPGLYRHFKGGRYRVLGIARHSETEEELVVYESLRNGTFWVRPLAMFASPVDRLKYPDAGQTWRFELVEEGPGLEDLL